MKRYFIPLLACFAFSTVHADTTSILCYDVNKNYKIKTYPKSLPHFTAEEPTHHGLYPIADRNTLTKNGYYYIASAEQAQELIHICGPESTEIKVNGSSFTTRTGYPILFKTNMNIYMRLRGEGILNIENIISTEEAPTIDFDKIMTAAHFSKGIYNRDFTRLSEHDRVRKMTPLYREIGKNDLGAAIIETTDDKIWIVFRGTDSLEDWTKGNLRSENLNASILGDKYHTGFYEMSRQHRQDIMDYIKHNTDRAYKKPTIYITGHSLGGGQAIVMAHFLMLEGYTIDLTTFAAPIPTDIKGAINIEALRQGTHSSILRVYHSDDFVPTVGINTGNWMNPVSFANSTNGFGYGLNLGNRLKSYISNPLDPHFMRNYIDTLTSYQKFIKFDEASDTFIIPGVSEGIDEDKRLIVKEILKQKINFMDVYRAIRYKYVSTDDILSKSVIVIDGEYYHDKGMTKVDSSHYEISGINLMNPLSEKEITDLINEFDIIE